MSWILSLMSMSPTSMLAPLWTMVPVPSAVMPEYWLLHTAVECSNLE